MSKRIALVAGVVLLSVPSVAAAKDDMEPRMRAVLACEAIGANEARLQCFDQAILPLKQAVSRGNMVFTQRRGPAAREGVVKASGVSGENRYWILFENGDRWSTTTKNSRKLPPAGAALKVKRTPMGTYWISGRQWSESQATFVGPEPDSGQ
jgi:hypothetical protein